jgi:hypothetical protein
VLELRSAVAIDDVQDRIFAQSEPMADFSIRLAFTDKLEDLGGKTIRFHPLARPPAEHHAALSCRGDSGADPLAQQIALKLRERRHQGGNELALRATQVKLQAGLGDEGYVPRLQESNHFLGVSTAQLRQVDRQVIQTAKSAAKRAAARCSGVDQRFFAAPHTPRKWLLSL